MLWQLRCIPSPNQVFDAVGVGMELSRANNGSIRRSHLLIVILAIAFISCHLLFFNSDPRPLLTASSNTANFEAEVNQDVLRSWDEGERLFWGSQQGDGANFSGKVL